MGTKETARKTSRTRKSSTTAAAAAEPLLTAPAAAAEPSVVPRKKADGTDKKRQDDDPAQAPPVAADADTASRDAAVADSAPLLMAEATAVATAAQPAGDIKKEEERDDDKLGGWWWEVGSVGLLALGGGLGVGLSSSSGGGGGASGSVDTLPPASPVFPASVSGLSGGYSNNAAPTFSGTAEAGATVRIYDGDVLLGETKVDQNGFWSLTPSNRLSEGSHSITYRITDAAGNSSNASPAINFIVDTIAPGQLGIQTSDGDVSDGLTLQITLPGNANASDTITVVVTTQSNVQHTLTRPLSSIDITNGSLSVTLPAGVFAEGPGYYTVYSTISDAANNRTATSTPILYFTGLVQDDYIAGATVFIDSNRNGVYDQGETVTTSDAQGHFKFSFTPEAGIPILAFGGVDTTSGSTNSGVVYKVYPGLIDTRTLGVDVVLSPLSTLIASVAESMNPGTAVDATALRNASAVVNSVLNLGMTTPENLLSFDPVAAALSGTATAQERGVLSANREINVILGAVSSLINGASATPTTVGSDYAVEALANLIVQSNRSSSTVSLSSAGDLQVVLLGAMNGSNQDGVTNDLRASSAADIASLAATIGTINSTIATSTLANPLSDAVTESMRVASDALLPTLYRIGNQAAAERGGDISFATAFDQVRDATQFVADAINDLGDLRGFETNPANGYFGGFIPLNIQMPALGTGNSTGMVTIAGMPDGVSLYKTTPTGQTLLTPGSDGTYSIALSDIGMLAVRALDPGPAAGDLIRGTLRITAATETQSFTGTIDLAITEPVITPTATIGTLTDDVGPVTGTIAPGTSTDDPRPHLSGTLGQGLTAGQQIMIYGGVDGTDLLGTATATGTTWNFQVPHDLTGTQQFVVRIVDGNGDIITASRPYTTSIITADQQGAANIVVELSETDAPLTTRGLLSGGSSFTPQTATVGTWGTFSVNAAGSWSFVANGAHNRLNAGDTVSDTFQVAGANNSVSRVTVTIHGTNDAATVSTATVQLTEEDSPEAISTSGTLTISDLDNPAEFVSQTAVAGAYGLFSINAQGHWTYVADSAHDEFEEGQLYVDTFVVTAVDGTRTSVTITMVGTSDNEPPVITSADRSVVPENAATATVVYTATASDPNEGDVVTYSLGGPDADLFDIDAVTGAVTLKNSANYESKDTYLIIVVATDADGASGSSTVTIHVTDVNDAPTIDSAASGSIAENAPANTVVYTVGASDEDAGDRLRYSLDGPDAALFTIDPDTGEVRLIAPADYEDRDSYAITVIATDTDGVSTGKDVTITVVNQDESTPVVTSGDTAAPLAENSGAGLVIYTAVADDSGDVSDGITWSLKPGSDPGLHIDPQTGKVTLLDNPDYETTPNYTFTVVATDGAGNAAEKTVTLAVLNDDAAVTVSAGEATVVEGAPGTTTLLTYTVTRTKTANASSVDWSISGVDAADLAPSQTLSGSVSFAEGQSSATFTVELAGDSTIEADETLLITLANPGDDLVLGAQNTAAVTIVNDDALVSISATTPTIQEGHNGETRVVTFTLTRTNTLSATSVQWEVAGGTVDAADFGGTLPSGTATFAVGQASTTITVTVTGDRTIEPDEALTVRLANPGANLGLGTDTATTTVVNDDLGFSIFAGTTDVVEGGAATQTAITFQVVRSESLNQPMTIDYRLIPRGNHVPDSLDFTASPDALGDNGGRPSGSISFGANETTKTVTIYVAGDATLEQDEAFSVVLANAPAGTVIINGEIQGIIRADETQYDVTAVTASTLEGNGTGGVQQFLVTRTGNVSQAGAIGYVIAGYGENPAEDDDFENGFPLTGIITFAAGETSKIISVPLAGDSLLEGYESYSFTLQAQDANSLIHTGTATVTIVPDDAAVSITATDAVVKEGSGSTTRSHTFTLTRSAHLDSEVTVDWHLVGSGANQVNADDFGGSLPSGSITFAAGETTKLLTITPRADTVYEPHEGYEIVLTTGQAGVVLEQDRAAGMILNDDSGLTLVATNLDRPEGNPGGTSQLTFTVQRSGDTTGVSTVHWELVPTDGNGVVAADFASGSIPSGVLTFTRGVSSLVVNLPLTVDNLIEPDKGFTIRLSNPSEGTQVLVGEVSGAIRNDDAAFTLQSIDPVVEGHSGSTTVTFTVTRTGDINGTDTVEYVVSPAGSGAAADGADFAGGLLPGGLITFNAGETSKTVTLSVAGDHSLESDETFTITLVNPGAGTTIASGTADVVILNDDDILSIAATSADLAEAANGDSREFTFTVTRTGFLDRETTVDWSVAGQGAHPANAADFGGTLPAGSLTFAANETSKTITVTVSGDYYQEADEGFRVQLTNPSAGTTLGTASADGVIRNDDTGLVVSATTTTLTEGESGTQTHVFTVTRSGVVTGTTTVNWAVSGSGDHPVDAADFFGGALPSGTITFGPGETSKTIEIQTSGDTAIESTEGFTVTLSGADGNADIMTATAAGSVVADDIGIAITAGNASVLEGAAGESRVLTFTVTRSGDLASPVVIDWIASGMTADDFAASTPFSGTLSFAAHETVKTINLPLLGDNVNESTETLTVTLSNPAGNPAHDRTYLTSATAATEVVNDDAALVITADTATQAEQNTDDGASTPFTFTVTRSGDTSAATTVEWVLQLPGGAGSAAANDFIGGQDALGSNDGLPSGTVTFAAGESTAQIIVLVATDNQVEQDESFTILLQGAGDNTELTGSSAGAVITNDDTGFSITALSADHAEGQGGTVTYTFRVTRAGDISDAATVDWAVGGSGASPADAADFGGLLPSGTLSFAANEASKEISFTVSGDTVVEQNEEFTVTISNARLTDNTPQLIQDANATGIIRNDDQSFSVSAANATVAEGSAGTTQIAYTVTRSGDLSGSATINYAVTGGAGVTAADIQGGVLPSGTLTFAANETSKTVTFDLIADTLAEGDETFTLTLTDPSAGIIGTATANTVVTNDDTNFVLSAPAAFHEGASGSTAVTFTVTRSGDTSGAGSVKWSVAPASGLTTADFTGNQDSLGTNSGLPSGTVTFTAGQTSTTITINVAGDLTLENDETLRVILADPNGGTIEGTDGDKSTTILTDDDSFSISTLTTSRAEGNSDSAITYTVTRTGSLVGARDLTWTITGTNGFTTAGDLADGQAASGTVSFADGQVSATIVVNVKGDSVVESDETMTVTLSGAPANSVIGTASASTVLTNDDASVSVATLLADKNEGNSSYVDYTFTVTRTGNTAQTSTVSWTVDTGVANAVNGSDFFSSQPAGVFKDGNGIPYGTVSFAGGETSKTVTLRVAGDSALEADEVLRLALSNASAGTQITTATADGFVRNDDAQFNITAGTANLLEGDGGHGTGKAMTYTVTRTGNLNQVSTVDWSVVHGTTTSSDFTNGVSANLTPGGTLTFANGVATQTITVYVYGDTGVGSVEGDETFSIQLANPNAGSSLGSTTSYNSTILDDDTRLTLSVDDYSKAESVAGSNTVFTYTVTRSGYTGGTTGFNWSTGNTDPSNGSSAYMTDYTQSRSEYQVADAADFQGGFTSGSGSFAAGETSKQFTVTALGDNTAENDEWFAVSVTGTSGYDEINVIYDDPSKSTGTLLGRSYYGGRNFYDNQAISSATNGVANNTNYLFSSIERDEAEFYLSDREVASTSVQSLSPGNGLQSRAEGDTPADGGAGATIVTIGGVEYGYVEHIFAVQRQVATAGTASVGWRIGTYNSPAVSADDFLTITRDGNGDITSITTAAALPSGTVTFEDGQQWAYIKFYTKVDDIGEYDEYFSIYLENPSAGSSINIYDTASYPQYNIGIIANDDTRFDASVNDVVEGGTLTYTVTRSGDSRGTDTVDWSLALPGSEATNESNNATGTWYKLDPSDIDSVTPSSGTASYNAGTRTWSGTLTFADGETTKTITVVTIDDAWTETWREELPIVLSNPVNVNAGEPNHDLETPSTGYTDTARIYDNESDPLISVSVSSATTWEGTGANDSATGNSVTFTITRSDQGDRDGSLNYPTTVAWRIDGTYINWASANGSAEILTFGGDASSVQEPYSNQTYGLVTFAAGETTKNVVVTFTGDRYVENDKTLTFTVLDPDDAEHGPLYTDAYGPADINNALASVTTTLKNDDIRLWVGGWDTYSGDTNGYYTNVQTSAYEGNPLTFMVNRYGRLDNDIVVNYTLVNGTTTNGDFTTMSGSFTLAGQAGTYGEYTYSISLADLLADDTTVEANETFTLRLSAPGDSAGSSVRFQSYYADYSGSYTSPSTTLDVRGTIYDDDTTYTLTPASTSLVETDQGANQTFSFDVTRGGTGYTGAATLKWRVEAVGGNPASTSDFTSTDTQGTNNGLPSGTVSFASGELTKTFSVLVKGDLIAENSETFRVVLYEDVLTSSSPTITNTQNVASATLTIVTDDTGISIADSTLAESDANQTMTFTITRSGDTTGTSSMTWTLYHGTTAAGDVSGATSGTVSFSAGETSKTISVTVVGDTTPEADETFTIQLSNLVGVDEAIDISATGTIRNDDSSFSIAPLVGSSPESGSQTFTITRTHDTVQNQTITWSVGGGSATAADFGGSLPSGSVTFAPGEMSKTITITPTNDATPETDETYTVTIALGAGTAGDTISQATASGTIENDDAALHIAADHATIQEGHSGTTALTFTVTRTGNADGTASVDWKLSSAGAVAADFATADALGSNGGLPSGTVTFADGEYEKTITIQVVGDEVVEGDEAVTITLANASGGSILTATAAATILNDDSTIAIAAVDAVKNEGNSGTTPFTFTITRTGYLGEAETVTYSITGSGAHAADDDDFAGITGTVTLAAGQASTTLTIDVAGDLAGEPDEGFTVTLSNPSSGMTITQATATGTIQADDIVFDVTAPATQVEGNPGDTTYFDFVVTRSGNLTGSQTLTWSVAGIGADPTSAGDFDSTGGTITFDANDTSKTIRVPVKGDYLGESDESFRLTLAGPDGVIFLHTTADAVITDDEASLRISATDAVKSEGADGMVNYTFTVTRTGNTALEATVDWAVAAGSADADDLAGGLLPSGTLTFASGVNSQTITVQVAGDTVVEGDETFTVNLGNPSTGAAVVVGSATGTIISDDVEWTIAAVSLPDGEGDGPTAYVFRVTRTGSLSATTLDWSVAGSGDHAAAAADFTGGFFPSGTLVFAQGQASQDFTVSVAGDSLREADEGFRVTLTAPVDSLTHSYGARTADAVIVNDDDVLAITALAADRAEGTGGTTAFTFTVTRSGSLSGSSTVGWRILHTDTGADDFAATSGTVTFADGQDTAILSVLVAGDRDLEGAEAFTVELCNPGAGSTIDGSAATAAGLIRDDDVDLALATANGSVVEGDGGTAGQATFTVTRSGDLSGETTVSWNVVAGTATAADFAGGLLPGGTLTFAAGETEKTITVNLAGDGAWEGNETFTVQLSNASAHADITVNNVAGQIIDDDDTLTLSAVAVDHAEGTGGSTLYTFRIDRAGTATGATSVEWAISGSGSRPASADDFAAVGGTVQFADGETSRTFTVEVVGDGIGEYDETFDVTLVNPADGSTVTGPAVTGTIRNDDAALVITADAVSVAEGADGVETVFTFTVTRSGDLTGAVSALWEVIASGSRPANAGDFGGVFPTGAVAFQPGESTQQISVSVLGDAVGEYDETFSIRLFDADGATILEQTAETTIANDDTGISVIALDADKAEGNSGVTNFTFKIERVGLAAGEASVNWAVHGTGSYPAGTDDFVGGIAPSGTVHFADGESERIITIQVAGDHTYGQDQTFQVQLTNPSGANLIQAAATGTIRNDDSQISVTALNPSQVEGNSGSLLYSFEVTRLGAVDTTATIDWQVAGSGGYRATAADFVGNQLPSGSLTFAPGETSKIVTVAVAGDTLTEVDEQFSLLLSNPGDGVSIAPNAGSAAATIVSDDEGVVLIALDTDRSEGAAGTTNAYTYQVLRSGNISDAVTITYTISGDVDADDFVSPLTGTFQMAAGQNSHLLTLTARGDATVEPDEQFQVSLSGSGVNIDSTPVTSYLRNDDAAGPGDDAIMGGNGNDILSGLGGGDTISAGGGNDLIVVNADNIARLTGSLPHLSVDGGAGIDTLKLSGSGIHLDLSVLTSSQITGIEKIDLSGSGANQLSLTAAELLHQEVDVFATGGSGLHQLLVDGDADDTVIIGNIGDWQHTPADTHVIGAVTYDVYTQSDMQVQLLINQAISSSNVHG
ncbi:Calx-beta domain-containing protein [Trichlorobacter ammonificans]|uniref:Cadherin domain/calx-beta domain protein n=1 Tax=Trichlorobacter ammonificans TaxID=2916410 RepID=A0ABM9D694_9BACT|nr:Calx-beta domain-containing protein [Trichlorobacter ammonificans]CAH2030771.1 Cadherin domain/calx-beta domain protein [Trichlorobacter ammonificans]